MIPELGFIDITRRRGLVLQEYCWFVNGLSNQVINIASLSSGGMYFFLT